MRFAVDAHQIGQHLTGNEVYIRSLLNAFAQVDEDSDFITYLSVSDARSWVPSRFRIRPVSPNPFIRLGWDLSNKLGEDVPDLIHVQYTSPLNCPVPIVVSVHDVSFLEHPEYFTRSRAFQLKLTVKRTVKRAARVITGSEFSRRSIARAYGLDPARITVIPNAASPFFRPLHIDNALDAVRKRFQLPAPYILCVGDLQPRKNQIGLVRAFTDLVRNMPQLRHRLVLAGKETWFGPKVREAVRLSGVSDRIRLLGFVSDEELLHLYNACDIFVFPSLYEGFGLPVLEAMACGRAVACSNSSALPEVADGAAILFDTRSVTDISRAMGDLLTDSELRIRMERLGQQRCASFSWQATAQKTVEVYYAVAQSGKRSATAPAASLSSR